MGRPSASNPRYGGTYLCLVVLNHPRVRGFGVTGVMRPKPVCRGQGGVTAETAGKQLTSQSAPEIRWEYILRACTHVNSF